MTHRPLIFAQAEARLKLAGRQPLARLLALASMVGEAGAAGIGLSMPDIEQLRVLIQKELARGRLHDAEIVADQILFMIVGASRSQRERPTAETWALVFQSIGHFLQPQKTRWYQMPLLMLASLMLIAVVAISTYTLRQQSAQQPWVLNEASPANSVSSARTVDQLIEIYNDMKNGVCQMPQAAMLPEKDRQAFLAFVNEGVVEITTADRLKHALDYVHCEYPQALMQSAKP